MSEQRSREDLIKFIDYLGEKGLVTQEDAAAKRSSVAKVLAILNEEEARDVTVLDPDSVMDRFVKKFGREYRPGSLGTYRSRLRAAIEDYRRYLSDPLSFKSGATSREIAAPSKKRKAEIRTGSSTALSTRGANSTNKDAAEPMGDTILPIQIRVGLTVRIQGLPYDLTEAEAARLAAVIKALAVTR